MRRVPAKVLLLLDTGGELNFAKGVAMRRKTAKILIDNLSLEDTVSRAGRTGNDMEICGYGSGRYRFAICGYVFACRSDKESIARRSPQKSASAPTEEASKFARRKSWF